MSELVKFNVDGAGGVLDVIHGLDGKDIPMAFERDIFLFDTYIAGTSYISGIEKLEEHILPDDYLEFYREPDNRFDPRAIVIRNRDGVKYGYVPKHDNIVFSRLMDAGKMLFGKVVKKEKKGNWLKIDIKIYLHE